MRLNAYVPGRRMFHSYRFSVQPISSYRPVTRSRISHLLFANVMNACSFPLPHSAQDSTLLFSCDADRRRKKRSALHCDRWRQAVGFQLVQKWQSSPHRRQRESHEQRGIFKFKLRFAVRGSKRKLHVHREKQRWVCVLYGCPHRTL